ncbi:MAG: hypothetical protein WHU54_05720 [Candidatus Bathyarchaeia archaeon]
MAKKVSISHWIKLVIETLKDGEKSWSDLLKLGIPKKTLERLLKDYLIYWGLVRKEGNYYVWYEYIRTYQNAQEYNIALEHSKRVVPEFLILLCFSSFNTPNNLCHNAKEHLKTGYPKIYEKLLKIEEFIKERKKQEQEKSKNDIFEEAERIRMEWLSIGGLLMGKCDFAEQITKNDSSWKYNIENEIRRSCDMFYMKGANKNVIDLFAELARDVLLLASKVENGEPLKGKCPLCPEIRILQQAK